MSDRELVENVVQLIENGEYDKEKLIAEVEEITSGRMLGKVFSFMRFIGKHPIMKDGKYVLLSDEEKEEWDAAEKERKAQAKAKKKAKPKTPAPIRYNTKLSRFNKTFETYTRLQKTLTGGTEKEKCRLTIAQLQHRVAAIEYNELLDVLVEELGVPDRDAVVAKIADMLDA